MLKRISNKDLLLPLERAARFSDICQDFKKEIWKKHNFTEEELDELCLVAYNLTKEKLKKDLLTNGHGGGNWRRLINQL